MCAAAAHPIPLAVVGHWIGGASFASQGERAPVFNPSRGELSREVALATREDVDRAVQSARSAFPAWAALPPLRRARVLFRFKDGLDRHASALARLISEEHGKTLEDAQGEVARGVEVVEFACGAPQLLKGEYSDSVGTGVDTYSLRQPLGVVVGVTPFNFPAMVPLWMFPIALACGNTFVLKPSERDPSASLLLAELLQQAGLPAGAFNVVQGDKGFCSRQASPGARRGQEPPGRHARCGHEWCHRGAGGRRLRLGGGALHGDLGSTRRGR
jgi:malonate-semialdehyde dehydrogenase (acetylating)/methylmalonate-semialdehyde dehydrogenase